MGDLGSHYPVEITEPEETKNMKMLWVESKVKELESKIANLKRQLEGAELLRTECLAKYNMLKNSVDVK